MKDLGELEAEVMARLWAAPEPASVRDLVELLAQTRKLAYTTVLTVVTHLHEKGWVDREKRGRAFYYRPSRTRAEATSRAMRELLDDSSDVGEVLAHFATTLTPDEYDALSESWDAQWTAIPRRHLR